MKTIDWKTLFKKALPHIGAIAVMYLLTIIYFSPMYFDNKKLPQSDMVNFVGSTKAVIDYQFETGECSGWTNNIFSGMPMESVYGAKPFNIFNDFSIVLRGGLDYLSAGILFSYLIGFYIFMVCLGSNAFLALLGAIAYAFCSYNLIIIDAGHVTKAYAMAFIAPLLGGVILAYRKKYLAGFLITMIFMGVELAKNHVQITYYAGLMVLCIIVAYFIQYLVKYIKDKETFVPFWKASALLLLAAFLGLAPNFSGLYASYVYSKDTIRGGTELTIGPDGQPLDATAVNEKGLDIDYAYAWSYGKAETFTLLVPNTYGSGHTILEKDDPTTQTLRQAGYGSTYLPTYWGEQPFTAGPVYAGAIVCFLFILGLCVVKGPERWWLLATVIISFILAWGKNLMPLNGWLFEHLPLYNKFRAPSMALIIAGVAMPMLGMMALKDIFSGNIDKKEAWKATRISFYITGGLCLLLIILGKTVFSFQGLGDGNFQQQLLSAGFDKGSANRVLDILHDYRQSMLVKDAFRSLIFIALAFGVIALSLKDKLKKQNLVISILAVLVLVDMWPVCKRYLDNSHFQNKKKVENPITASKADEQILKDSDINYRVANLATSTFNDAQTSYFHKSIGGYSAVKLRRYQDMIDFYISSDIKKVYAAVMQSQGDLRRANPDDFKILNLLNTKYFILQGKGGEMLPLENPHPYGNAWFVNNIQWVDNADQEIMALRDTDLKHTALVDKRFEDVVTATNFVTDSSARIENTVCKPNKLCYSYDSQSEQAVVFSEVFYDKGGWDVTVDGENAKHFRADYLLRAMILPAGHHDIVFTYTPYARVLGNKISSIASIVCILIMLGCIAMNLKRKPLANN